MLISRFFAAALFAVAFSFPAAAADKLIRVGYIELGKVFESLDDRKDADAEYKKRQSDLELKLRAKEEEIRALELELRDGITKFSDDDVRNRRTEIELKKKELEDLLDSGTRDLESRGRDLSRPVLAKIFLAVKKVAEREGYSLVLNKSENFVYADLSINITQQVIDQLKLEKQQADRN